MEMNLMDQLGASYRPVSALLVYGQQGNNDTQQYYIEHFDIDVNGRAVNAHPLTVQESSNLLRALNVSQTKRMVYLKPMSILPQHVLYVDPTEGGAVIWYTKRMSVPLYFTERLGIDSGLAFIPAMIWKVQRRQLYVFALQSDSRPKSETKLFKAPFFNIYNDGKVCLGTIDIEIERNICLEDFMASWQEFFFNSRFSHLLGGGNPVKGNCVQLWKRLIGSGKAFPKEVLQTQGIRLNDILK